MLRHAIRFATLVAIAMSVSLASAQFGGQSGSGIQSFGRVPAVGQIPGVGGAGISNFQMQNTRASSGVGRTPSTASVSTLPGIGGSGGSKPFADIDRGPTVSPYLNLFNTGVGGGSATVDNYNVLVRPQLEQQRTNRRLQLQSQQLNQRVQAISARPAYEATGNERITPTGHPTVFGYYSRFYPGKSRPGQRRR